MALSYLMNLARARGHEQNPGERPDREALIDYLMETQSEPDPVEPEDPVPLSIRLSKNPTIRRRMRQNPCACGCGLYAAPSKRYVKGHYREEVSRKADAEKMRKALDNAKRGRAERGG